MDRSKDIDALNLAVKSATDEVHAKVPKVTFVATVAWMETADGEGYPIMAIGAHAPDKETVKALFEKAAFSLGTLPNGVPDQHVGLVDTANPSGAGNN
jgi:hypothetical protein